VYPLLPPGLRREEWALAQFAIDKRLHQGYASEVYRVRVIVYVYITPMRQPKP
jgi:hypothetical protein